MREGLDSTFERINDYAETLGMKPSEVKQSLYEVFGSDVADSWKAWWMEGEWVKGDDAEETWQ